MYFAPVALGSAPENVFIGARSVFHGNRKQLTRSAALELYALRAAAITEAEPYVRAQLAYLAALGSVLDADLITGAPDALTYGPSREDAAQRKHASLVGEFALVTLSVAEQLERNRAFEALVGLWNEVVTIVRSKIAESVLALRFSTVLAGSNPRDSWLVSVDVAHAIYAIAMHPPVDRAVKYAAARTFATLAAMNKTCEHEARRLAREVLEESLPAIEEVNKAIGERERVSLRARALKACGKDNEAKLFVAQYSARFLGITAVLATRREEAMLSFQPILKDLYRGGGEEWPPSALQSIRLQPETIAALMPRPPLALETIAEGVAAQIANIPNALELRSYAIEDRDTEAVVAIDAWLRQQGYILQKRNPRDVLVAAGLLSATPPLHMRMTTTLGTIFSAVRDRVVAMRPAPTPPTLSWDAWRAQPPAFDAWTDRPAATADEWRAWLPADAKTRHDGMRVYPRKAWRDFGVPEELLPPRAIRQRKTPVTPPPPPSPSPASVTTMDQLTPANFL